MSAGRQPSYRQLPIYFWPAAVVIVGFSVWCVALVLEVRTLRADVVTHVGALMDVRAAADQAGKMALGTGDKSWSDIDQQLADVEHNVGDHADVGPLQKAIAALRRDIDAGNNTDASLEAVIAAQGTVVRQLRQRTGELSTTLGDKWTSLYLVVGAALVLASANLFLLVVAARRRRDAEARGAEIAKHMDILEDTARAIADGDLEQEVAGDGVFESALERIRGDLVEKISSLDARNRENEELNRELKHQIGERSRELEAALKSLREGGDVLAEVGSRFADRYDIMEVLGEGSHGNVYRVCRQPDGRQLALKVLKRVDNEIVAERFVREAKVLAEIRHPNVVEVHDVGLSPEGRLYVVTELIDGKNLHQLSRRYGDADWALPIVSELAEGLAAVHGQGIVHRDVKPANVVVPFEPGGPRAKLIDFGVARLAAPASSDSMNGAATPLPDETPDTITGQRTRVGVVVGTPRYVAPEVIANKGHVTAAADVFALGVTAYQLLGKKRPFPQPTYVLIARYGELPPPTPLALLNKELPPATAAAVMSCLEADPALRPSASELVDELAVKS